jgi:hypothetical protein
MEQFTIFEELRNAPIKNEVTVLTPVMKETILQTIDSEVSARNINFNAEAVESSNKILTFSSEADLHPLLNDLGNVISRVKEAENILSRNRELTTA